MLIIILRFSLLTRLGFFILQILVSLLPDHNADAFIDQSVEPHPWIIDTLLGGFDSWDSQYYLSIAEKGYVDEQFLAFFPLYPLLMRSGAAIALSPLCLFSLPLRSVLLISGWLITNLSFMVAVLLLYKLTLRLTSDPLLSLYSCFFFSLNPASVFMCSVYTESLFACLCFGGMLAVAECRPFWGSLLFGLATAVRSNGIFTVGFLLYFHAQIVALSLKQLIQVTVQVAVVLSPFICFQAYSYNLLCHGNMGGGGPSLINRPSVCDHTLPIVYSYLQKEHWGLGFLGYYQVKQIPNFILALPMVLLVMACVKAYISSLPFLLPTKLLLYRFVALDKNTKRFEGNLALFPYVVHGTVMVLVALTIMHVQVITRFICSSSPIVYWFCSFLLLSYYQRRSGSSSATVSPPSLQLSQTLVDLLQSLTSFRSHHLSLQFITFYFSLYIVLGFLLHCNFLPWT